MKILTRGVLVGLLLFFVGSSSIAEKITWERIVLGPGGGWQMVTLDPVDKDIVYISSDMQSSFKSMDGGKTWEDLTAGLLKAAGTYGTIWDNGLAINPANNNILYTALSGVLKSTDGGKAWELVLDNREKGGEYRVGGRIGIDPINPDVVYAGFFKGHLYKTDDGGKTWKYLSNTSWDASKGVLVSIRVSHKQEVYACMYGKGILKSIDKGETWESMNNGLPHLNIPSFQYSYNKTKKESALYAFLKMEKKGDIYEGGLYKSINGGDNWEKITIRKYEKLGRPNYCRLAVSPTDPDIIYVTANNTMEEWGSHGIYRSTDGGKTWGFFPGKYENDLLGWMPGVASEWGSCNDIFAVSPHNPKVLFRGDGVFYSDDGAVSWKILSQEDVGNGYYRSTGLENICVIGIAVDPKDSRRVYLGVMDNGFLKSRDSGKSWKPAWKGLGGRGAGRGTQIIVDPDNPSTIYFGSCYTAGVSKGSRLFAITTDYAETWEKSSLHPEWGLPKEAQVVSLAMDLDTPFSSRVLYASILGKGVYKSENKEKGWKPINKGLPEISEEGIVGTRNLERQVIQLVKPKGSDLIYALFAEKMFFNVSNVESISGTSAIYISHNRGESWQKIDFTGASPALIKRIAVDPGDPGRIYAACLYDGLWEISGKGQAWKRILSIPDTSIYDVTVDNFNPDRIYAAVEGRPSRGAYSYGIWMSENKGKSWTKEAKGFGHRQIDFLYADPVSEGIIWAATRGNAVFKGYVKGVASPEKITKPIEKITKPVEEITKSASSAVEKKTEIKGLIQEEIIKKIKESFLSVARTKDPIKIDGELSEESWNKAKEVTDFYDVYTKSLVSKQTRVKALYDEEYLYLGFICMEPNAKNITAEKREHDGDVWNDDAVEVFIAHGEKGKVYQFIVNAVGSRFDATYDYMNCDKSWNPMPDWRVKTMKGGNLWTAEIAIPFKAVQGEKDQPYKVKLCRDDMVDSVYSSWPVSMTQEYINPPAMFATLKFK